MEQNERPGLLVVDDSAENLQVLCALLEDQYRIRVARSGERALELLRADPLPDLVLLDVMMTGMDGFSVCLSIKADPRTTAIPVIFITALQEATDEERGFLVGGADFITKPFNPDIVRARIRTHLDLKAERLHSEALLRILLPDQVIGPLMRNGHYPPERHEQVTILFADLVGFTGIAATIPPEQLIEELSELFSAFDNICARHGATRIKTIGDAYMAVTGLFGDTHEHAPRMVDCGLDLLDHMRERNLQRDRAWECRVGIHSGSVIAGVIGRSRFIYDILGDDVNIASRVEGVARPMEVTITDSTRNLMSGACDIKDLGGVELKGRGLVALHTVQRRPEDRP